MKMGLQILLYLTVATALGFGSSMREPLSSRPERGDDKAINGLPKLFRISGRFDGSGRIAFRGDRVRYEHKHWSRPRDVLFDGETWTKLDQTPSAWRDLGKELELTKAWIVKRQGRDVIALEHTANGFDLYICDSPPGAGDYTVTIAVPRQK